MGNRIYGCDDCLAVCPWNRFAAATRETKLQARPDLIAPPLAELAALDDAAFRARFAGSPVKRIGRDRFVRNVLIAIGNAADLSLLPAAAHLARRTPTRWSPRPPPGRWRACGRGTRNDHNAPRPTAWAASTSMTRTGGARRPNAPAACSASATDRFPRRPDPRRRPAETGRRRSQPRPRRIARSHRPADRRRRRRNRRRAAWTASSRCRSGRPARARRPT